MTVPFLDLYAAHRELQGDLDGAIARVMERSQFILGSELEQFEAEFADFVGARYCVGVGSGLDALELSLRAANVGTGDEVIVPGHTFIATWLAVSRVGATVVPVDVDPHSFNLAMTLAADAITSRTRAIIPVHLYGRPVDVDILRSIVDGRDIVIIEDAAQAHGASLRGRRAGSLGDIAAWSFYPGKNLGALGDGGAITTNSSEVATAVRQLRNYGSTFKYHHERMGFNSRLDELQAAILRVKLQHLDTWNARRRQVAAVYGGLSGTSPLQLPEDVSDAELVWHLFVVRSPRRAQLSVHLAEAGIQTQIHYPVPPHRQPAYRHLSIGSLPVTDRLAGEVLSLPMGPHLSSDQADRVIAAVRTFDRPMRSR